jgi:hypothetical protein
MHGLFHEFISNASSMARNHFIMKRLAHFKLGTVESDHDPVKHGPTRGPRFDALLRTGRQISDKYTVSFTKFYRTSKTLRGRASSWQIKSMPCSEWLKSAKLLSRRVRPGDRRVVPSWPRRTRRNHALPHEFVPH